MIRPAHSSDRQQLLEMWSLLWPDGSREEHLADIDDILTRGLCGGFPITILVFQSQAGALAGFVEADLRSHADGCDPSHPVGYVEGWFVHEPFRQQGVGGELMRAAEDWARGHGCREMASDTWITHETSQRAHQALGYEIVDRCVHFRKLLNRP